MSDICDVLNEFTSYSNKGECSGDEITEKKCSKVANMCIAVDGWATAIDPYEFTIARDNRGEGS
jgi:hypothetical protein